MKKFALGFSVLAILAVGFFFIPGVAAEDVTPPTFPKGRRGRAIPLDGETGPLHDLTIEKIAEKTELTVEEITALQTDGDTIHNTLLDMGYTNEEIFVLMREVREEVFTQALEEGLIPERLGDGFRPGMKVSNLGPNFDGRPGQRNSSGFQPIGENGEVPPMREYHSAALADGLGITVDELNAYHEDGLTLFEIGAELDFTADEFNLIFEAARQSAYDQAVSEGLIPENTGQKRPFDRSRGPGRINGCDVRMFHPGN